MPDCRTCDWGAESSCLCQFFFTCIPVLVTAIWKEVYFILIFLPCWWQWTKGVAFMYFIYEDKFISFKTSLWRLAPQITLNWVFDLVIIDDPNHLICDVILFYVELCYVWWCEEKTVWLSWFGIIRSKEEETTYSKSEVKGLME